MTTTSIPYTKVVAHKDLFNVPLFIRCAKCNENAKLFSEIELSENVISRPARVSEEDYKCTYTCPSGHKTTALVEVKK